jgi:hypothetical protein
LLANKKKNPVVLTGALPSGMRQALCHAVQHIQSGTGPAKSEINAAVQKSVYFCPAYFFNR